MELKTKPGSSVIRATTYSPWYWLVDAAVISISVGAMIWVPPPVEKSTPWWLLVNSLQAVPVGQGRDPNPDVNRPPGKGWVHSPVPRSPIVDPPGSVQSSENSTCARFIMVGT